MRTLNLGILAHVDAGKTSLTERLLYDSGVIDLVGSVDDGSTQTDTLTLERQRGITIKSAVVSFVVTHPDTGDPVTINLIDTPGHPDFIAEVERVLDVLDGAVLVVSAVEGVQPQTRVLMRVLRRLGIPTIIMINKIDRRGAQTDELVADLARRLDVRPVVLGAVTDVGTPAASFTAYDLTEPAALRRVAEVLADQDERLLSAYVDDELSGRGVRDALVAQTADGRVHPLVFGSAITGAGIGEVRSALARWLPSPIGDAGSDSEPYADPDSDADPYDDDEPEPTARVFKIDRGPAGDKIAYVRIQTGTLHTRDRVWLGDGHESKITDLRVFADGTTVRRDVASAGQIAMISGLAAAQIGDLVSRRPADAAATGHAFAPPTWETVVVPRDRADGGSLHAALTQLAEQDPLINFRRHGVDGLSVALYGEVQKEVIEATLATDYGIVVEFCATSTICTERVTGVGEAIERIGTDVNPYLAGVGLRVGPTDTATGTGTGSAPRVGYVVDGFSLGTLPPAFFTAIEETVHETLTQGLHGWQVTDCLVTLFHTGYYPRQSHAHGTFDKAMSSTAGDFRHLTPLVLVDALIAAGTQVLEPVHGFSVDLPANGLSPVLALLAALGGVPDSPSPRGADWLLTGEIPADAVHTLTQRLPGLTSGEGAFESEFARYRPVHGAIPDRPRTDDNPLDRKNYLLRARR